MGLSKPTNHGGAAPQPTPCGVWRRRVLVAEDDPAQRGQLATILRGDGHEVVEASDGLELLVRPRPPELALARARVVPPARRPGGTIDRANWLTPYDREEIAADALRAGRGARLELTVATPGSDVLAAVRRAFGWLTARGVRVDVRPLGGSFVATRCAPELASLSARSLGRAPRPARRRTRRRA
jgi:hypothetical protein